MAFSSSVWGGSVGRKMFIGSRRRHSTMRRRHLGKGILGNIWQGIKSVASHAAPVIIPRLASAALSRFGLGRRRRRRTRGRSRMSIMSIMKKLSHGSRRRTHRRRRRHVGSRRRRTHGRSLLAGFGRRKYHRTRGKGAIGRILGGLAGGFLPF